jgi:predicted O-methyltransferase YrrM
MNRHLADKRPPMPPSDTNRAPASSLRDPRVARTLDRLHRRARTDLLRIALVAPLVVPDFLGFRKTDDDRLSRRMRSTYLPVSRSQGQMLYLVARSIDARRIVEFGTSFGISTLYLAAAVVSVHELGA